MSFNFMEKGINRILRTLLFKTNEILFVKTASYTAYAGGAQEKFSI
jgi:hypothetical protein